ncbi:hypothetical protein MKLM6_2810 [Methylomonas koyamae]|nr:hypothetical protein MKLM6_2810 [Methylomonas koyamae]
MRFGAAPETASSTTFSKNSMTDANTQTPTLTIGDKTHPIDSLSDLAKAQLANLQIVDAEIQRLQQQLGIAQVARETFLATLQTEFAKLG